MGFWDSVKKVVYAVESVTAKRPDGDLVTSIHPYRRMLPFLMPGRNESVVYYEDLARIDDLLDYCERATAAFGFEVDITHCLVAAASQGLHEVPRMNQFVVGQRLYKRNHVSVTFSIKRKRMDAKAKLGAAKMFFEKGESFEQICRRINDKIHEERSGEETHSDKDVAMWSALPRPVMAGMIKAVKWGDWLNVIPAGFIEHDGFYTSMFIANLGSLGMNAGYHHLYEYGNCPLFMMTGVIEERPLSVDGDVKPVRVLPIHWTYDERIDDGLTSFEGIKRVRNCLELPDTYFGELPPVNASK